MGAILALGVVGSAAGQGDENDSPVADATATPESTTESTPRPIPSVAATPRPTPEPPSGPRSAAIGEKVRIQCAGTDCLDITVSQPTEHATYPDPDGYYEDTPEVAGNVFIQVYVEYAALDDGATYGSYDWDLYVGGQQMPHEAFVMNGPQPGLSVGELANGRTAAGWVTYEVPPTGTVLFSYAPNYDGAPIFEVTLRP